jgi:hypothetical protein
MEQVASEVGPDVSGAKFDIDECPELAEKFEVQSIRSRAEVRRFVALVTKGNW